VFTRRCAARRLWQGEFPGRASSTTMCNSLKWALTSQRCRSDVSSWLFEKIYAPTGPGRAASRPAYRHSLPAAPSNAKLHLLQLLIVARRSNLGCAVGAPHPQHDVRLVCHFRFVRRFDDVRPIAALPFADRPQRSAAWERLSLSLPPNPGTSRSTSCSARAAGKRAAGRRPSRAPELPSRAASERARARVYASPRRLWATVCGLLRALA